MVLAQRFGEGGKLWGRSEIVGAVEEYQSRGEVNFIGIFKFFFASQGEKVFWEEEGEEEGKKHDDRTLSVVLMLIWSLGLEGEGERERVSRQRRHFESFFLVAPD